MLFPSQPWVYDLKVIPTGLLLDFAWTPHCAAPMNANIAKRRWMLWADLGLAGGGVRGAISQARHYD